MTLITITTWRDAGRASDSGTRRSFSVADFCSWLERPHARYPARPAPSWAPATFAGRGRSDDDVLEVSALVFDIASPSLAHIKAAFEGQLVLVHSAPASTTTAPRWHVVRLLSRPVTGAEHTSLWKRERDRLATLGVSVDEAMGRPSQIWSAPSEVADGRYVADMIDGMPLAVDAIAAPRSRTDSGAPSEIHESDDSPPVPEVLEQLRVVEHDVDDPEEWREQIAMPDDERFAGVLDAPPPAVSRRRSSADGEAEKVRLTELGNSLRLVQRDGHQLRFCRALGGWHVWDGKRWRIDTVGVVPRRAKAVVRRFWTEAAKSKDVEERAAMLAHARRSEKANALASMVKLAETGDGIAIDSNAFDADPWVLNCANGLLDLRTMKLRKHDPKALCKKLAPVSFMPGETAPLFERTIAEILPDAEVRALVQRFFGYSLTGVIRERVLVLLIGKGRNGKSLLVKLIVHLMGDYATYAAPGLLMVKEHGDRHPTELADLCGIRFAAMSEVKEGQTFDVETMKRLTGDEPVKARYMGRDFFTFDATWKLALAANHRPKVKDRSESSWDRLREVPFVVRIADDKEDKQLFEKLRAELPGILNWCLAGCAAWQQTGLGTAGAITAATAEYRAGQDPVSAFFTECVAFEARARIARKELYAAYEAWARGEGERFPVGTKTFAEAVRDKGAEDSAMHGIRCWVGVRLKDENERKTSTAARGTPITEQPISRPGADGCTASQSFIQIPPHVGIDRESCTQVHPGSDDLDDEHAFSSLLGGVQ